MRKDLFARKLLRPEITLLFALFVVISGCISYFTADGHAVIGQNFKNLDSERAIIKAQTVFYSLSLAGLSSLLFAVRYILSRKRN